MIPFGDLKRQYSAIKEDIDNALARVLARGRFILGEDVEGFEQEFARYCGKKYGIGVGSGTDALLLSLKAQGIGQGDEVITVPNTAIPTVSAIVTSGATPRFVDIGEDYLIDTGKIEGAITAKARAIIPVHLYGQACDMAPIIEIAEKHDLAVIEDCCQAHGTEYKGNRVPIGETGAFSFYPSKNLGAFGDAGMIVTDNKELSEKLRMLRNYGQSDRYNAEMSGINSRLSEIQAAILKIKLKYLDKWNDVRRKIVFFYNSELKESVKVPIEQEDRKHVYHLYVIEHEKRDTLQEYLKGKEINTIIHYPIPLHLQRAYEYLGYKEGDFPKTEESAKKILSLPCFPELKDEEIEIIVNTIKDFR